MYSRKERLQAVEFYLKYDKKAYLVYRELGYPDRRQLYKWYEDYLEEQKTGVIKKCYIKTSPPKYNDEQIQKAIYYYMEHGKSISGTISALGYPCKDVLRKWLKDYIPERSIKKINCISYSFELKKEAVLNLQLRQRSAKEVAMHYDISRGTLYKWRSELLTMKGVSIMAKHNIQAPHLDYTSTEEIARLKLEVKKLQMEKDILETAVAIIKKDVGVNPKELHNREKAEVIDALRKLYPLSHLLKALDIARSSFYYHQKQLSLPNKYDKLKATISNLFISSGNTYGYRRIHVSLQREGHTISEKVIRGL